MTTNYFQTNKSYHTINSGQFTQIKDIGLREISFSVLLPHDLSLPFVQSSYTSTAKVGLPILYLDAFRDFKLSKKPIQLMITRILPDGSEIFATNILVTLETYSVNEVALQNGDFTVDLLFREYISLTNKSYTMSSTSIASNSTSYTEQIERTSKDTATTYTVKEGDTLWSIAKSYLNNELLYTTLMELNQITNPKTLQIGTILKLQ